MSDEPLFHYTDSGLDWVFLANGYKIQETRYGTGVSIERADELHDVIALDIATLPFRLRGQEVRFLRSYLDMSQHEMGRLIGLSRSQVARIEAERDKPVTEAADRAARYFIALRRGEHDLADRLLELMNEIDRHKFAPASFKVEDGTWGPMAA